MAQFRENGSIPKYLGNSHNLNTLVQRFQITLQFNSQIRNQQMQTQNSSGFTSLSQLSLRVTNAVLPQGVAQGTTAINLDNVKGILNRR